MRSSIPNLVSAIRRRKAGVLRKRRNLLSGKATNLVYKSLDRVRNGT